MLVYNIKTDIPVEGVLLTEAAMWATVNARLNVAEICG